MKSSKSLKRPRKRNFCEFLRSLTFVMLELGGTARLPSHFLAAGMERRVGIRRTTLKQASENASGFAELRVV
jgi:hypothetical protein